MASSFESDKSHIEASKRPSNYKNEGHLAAGIKRPKTMTDVLPRSQREHRELRAKERAEKRQKRIEKGAKASSLGERLGKVTVALAGISIVAVAAPGLIEAKKSTKYGPREVVNVPYVVGSEPGEALVSEIRSDMHQVAPNQNPDEALGIIRTYLPTKQDQANYLVHAGEQFVFSVDKSSGRILPNPNPKSSGEGE